MKESILERYTRDNFASWLENGSRNLNSKDEKQQLRTFCPFYYYIRYYDIPSDGLKFIYGELSEKAKRNFRWGLRIAFSKMSQKMSQEYNNYEDSLVNPLRLLLYLASKIRATEMVPAIAEWWTISEQPKNEDQKNLFALSLKVISGMAPYPDVAEAIRQIINSHYFRPTYSGFAPMLFIALCRTEPERFPPHLELLRQDFSIMHKKTGRSKSFITAMRFSNYVDLDIIAEHLREIKLPEDEWFVEALFVGEKAPLKIAKR